MAGQHFFARGVGVPSQAAGIVEHELVRKVLGFHGDVCARPIRWKVGGLRFDHLQVVHQVGGEEVHFDGVSARVHGWNLGAIQRGFQIPVRKSPNKDEVAYRRYTRHALHGAGRVVVAGAFDLLAGDVVNAGGGLFLDVLHVGVPSTVHLGHHFGGLLNHKRLREEVELNDLNVVSEDHHFLDVGTVSNEPPNDIVGAWGQAFQAEVAVQVGHGSFGGAFDEGIGANQAFAGMAIVDFTADDPLRLGCKCCGQDDQELKQTHAL